MAEQLDLTTPIPGTAALNDYEVIGIHLNWMEAADDAYIKVVLAGDNGRGRSIVLATGAAARTLMAALNKADLSANSLQRRVLQKLIDDGHLAGTISGSPD